MGETYRARSRRSSFSKICTVMAMLQDRAAVSRHPRHSAAYRGSLRAGTTSRNIPRSAWAASAASPRAMLSRTGLRPRHCAPGQVSHCFLEPWLPHFTTEHTWGWSFHGVPSCPTLTTLRLGTRPVPHSWCQGTPPRGRSPGSKLSSLAQGQPPEKAGGPVPEVLCGAGAHPLQFPHPWLPSPPDSCDHR